MDGGAGDRLSGGPSQGLKPGTFSALLQEIARAPEGQLGEAWGPALHPGAVVGRFELVRELGRGGFGVVWEAKDRELGRSVAFKAVRAGGAIPMREERLLREAEAAAQLAHPNIVTLFDVGHCEQGPYLVLELLQGESLADRLARGPLPMPEAVRIAVDVARGLAHVHAHAVIHRDIKPANVFLCADGPAKLLDFGLAHAFGHPRAAGGTPAYMAPEQRRGAPEDERTDVFALGAVLYEMLTGASPFGAKGDGAARDRARPLVIAQAPALAELLQRMLHQDPVGRPRNAAEVLEALAAVQRALEEAPPPRTAWRPIQAQRRWRLALAVIAALAFSAVLLRTLWPPPSPESPPGERVVLAMADVANETGEPEMELSGLLRTVLEQSSWLHVLPRRRLVDILPQPAAGSVTRIDDETGLAAARLTRAQALLLAKLRRFGETYLMEARVVDPVSGERRFSFTEQERGKDGIPGLLDRVGERVRLLLGEEPGAIRQRSIKARAVTTSLEAWQRYASGMACFEQRIFAGSYDACLTDLQRAVSIDPGFALAHVQISLLHFLQGDPRAVQKAALDQAQRSPERVPPHERLRMRAWTAFLAGREVEAKKLLREAAEAAPDDKYAWWLAGDIPYHRDEFAEALPIFRRVHALDPAWLDANQHLVHTLGAIGDLEGIRALAGELAALGPRPGALVALCYADLWIDPSRALATCERARAAGEGEVGEQFLAIALLNLGAGDRLAAHLDGLAMRARLRSFDWYMSLWLLCQEGRWPEVVRRAAAAGDPDDSWFHSTYAEMIAGAGDRERVSREALRILELDRALASNLAVHLAYLGDLRRAADLAAYLPPGSPRVDAYQAVVRWRTGDVAGAVELLRKVAAGAPQSADPAIPPPLYLLGEALSEAGRDAEAVDALRRYRGLPVTYPTWFRPRALYYLARSLDRVGDRDGAREAIALLLRQWRRASPEQPLLAEARALGERLGAR